MQLSRYQGANFSSAANDQLPISFEEWKERARLILAKAPFDYIEGGAGSEDTIAANEKAFKCWRIRPRMMIDVSHRNLSVSMFNHTFPSPILLAPIGAQSIFHVQAELASAKAAASTKTPFIVSYVSSYTIEEIAAEMGDAVRWFQLYIGRDWDVTASLLHRAEKAGYSAIVVTVDLPLYGWRERDYRNAYFPYSQGIGLSNYTSDPVFMFKLSKIPGGNPQDMIALFFRNLLNPSLTWKDLASLRKLTNLPILLKGILHPEDAKLALNYGADGIIVSNHGGRQVDGAVAALDALPEIYHAVQGQVPVLMDSGIRRGADVIKALSLGAAAVLIGRPYVYGLAAAGEKGVRRVIKNLISDLDLTMANIGKRTTRELHQYDLVKQ
ncbi:alpha-hydroxy-acid oxidizing protein [Bacillus taeanensis]|uniref:L-lactate oxidase n=1 Tax=Bacillus taeanensis TaxID=273032 RepID=A0A366XQX0_9BACI|nr:alpha-hydroxy-acid oxidizing protein [Bacillus taeanensis]